MRRLVASCVVALAIGCTNCKTKPPARPSPIDARALRRTPIVAQRVSRPVAPDAGASLTLTDEPRLAAPPASPAGCTLEPPVRSVEVGEGTISFATAAAGARSLLALSTTTASRVWLARGDQSTLSLEAPFDAASTVSASGAHDTLVLSWAQRTSVARRSRPSIAVIDEREQLTAFALGERYALTMSEIACQRTTRSVRCAVGVGSHQEFEGDDEGAAQFLVFDPHDAPRESLTLEATPAVPRTVALAVVSVDPLRAIVMQGARNATLTDDTTVDALATNVIELGWLSDRATALTADAPNTERCQPGRWALGLSQSDGGIASISTVDSKPRGARVRATGSDGRSPIVLWLDAPQCNERAFVIRAQHGAEPSTALTSASEYDAASDRALVSVAWRDAERVRWARYRCPR